MVRNWNILSLVAVVYAVGALSQRVWPQSTMQGATEPSTVKLFSLDPTYAYASQQDKSTAETRSTEKTEVRTTEQGSAWRGVSGFFNVREAVPNVRQGGWELEFPLKWSTRSGESDEIEAAQSLKYGITDQLYVELEVEEPRLGEGGDSGAGDAKLQFFYQFLEETDSLPAIAGFVEGRFPTGDGSSGVDGRLSGIVTKSITDRARLHFKGWVMTANGSSGAGDEDREPFQWGLGPGFDYLINDDALLVLNYLHRNNPEEGLRDQDLLELGTILDLGPLGKAKQELKFAVDIGLNGDNSSPEFGAKIQWGIEW